MAAPNTADQSAYINYKEASRILGITMGSLHAVISRRHLHPVPDPANRRRRLLDRGEVEARARLTRRFPHGIQPHSIARADAARSSGVVLTDDERRLLVGAAAGTLALGSIVALARSDDPVIQGMAAGVLAALALLLIAEWYRAGTVDAVERRQLERSVSETRQHATPDEQARHVLSLIDRYGIPAATSGLAAS